MKLKKIQITICETCLDAIGQECHTPGCALFLHAVDLPINPEMYEVIDEWEEDYDELRKSNEAEWNKNRYE